MGLEPCPLHPLNGIDLFMKALRLALDRCPTLDPLVCDSYLRSAFHEGLESIEIRRGTDDQLRVRIRGTVRQGGINSPLEVKEWCFRLSSNAVRMVKGDLR